MALRLQPRDLDMDRMPQRRIGDRGALGDHRTHRLVRGDLQVDGHGLGPHAAHLIERRRRKTGPKHEAIRRRLA